LASVFEAKTPRINGMLHPPPTPRSLKARPVPIGVGSALERLGTRLTLARKLRGLTQEDLAHLADVSISTVRSLEAGADGVAVGNLLKVLQGLGLLDQVDQLLDPRHDPETLAFAERQLGSPWR
jgi:DNA-binding XRE family transcriptional regulator